MTITITAFERSPDGGKGLARDMGRWVVAKEVPAAIANRGNSIGRFASGPLAVATSSPRALATPRM